jgi:hypothetical protein
MHFSQAYVKEANSKQFFNYRWPQELYYLHRMQFTWQLYQLHTSYTARLLIWDKISSRLSSSSADWPAIAQVSLKKFATSANDIAEFDMCWDIYKNKHVYYLLELYIIFSHTSSVMASINA